MSALTRTREPAAGGAAYHCGDLVRDMVRLVRMAPAAVLVLGPVAGIGLQALAITATWPQWQRSEREIAVLEGIVAQQAHPSVPDVLPAARALAIALGIALAVSVFAWAAGVAVTAAPMRRAAWRAASGRSTTLLQSLRRTPKAEVRRRPPGGFIRLCLMVAGCALTGGALVAAIATTTAPAVTVLVRGTVQTVVEPTVWSMTLTAAVLSAAVVTMLPLGRAVLASAPLRAAAGAQSLDPAVTSPARPATSARRPDSAGKTSSRMTVILGIGTAALSAAFVVESVLARPIGDDYRYFAASRNLAALPYLTRYADTASGRYAQGLLVWVCYRLGGVASVQWLPVLLLGFLSIMIAATVRAFLPAFGALPRSASVAVGSAAAALAVTAVPSVADSYLWLTSSTVYVPEIGLLMAACLAVRAALRRGMVRRAGFGILAGVLVFAAQGFYEATSLLAAGAAVIFLAVLAARRSWRSLPVGVLTAAAAIGGLAAVYFAPAERARAQATGGGSLLVASLGTGYGQVQLWQSTGLTAWLLMAGLGLALAVLLRRSATAALLRLLVAAGLLILVIPAACAFVSFYTLNWAPWRTYTVASASLCWGVPLLAGALGALLIRQLQPAAAAGGSLLPGRRVAAGLVIAVATLTAAGVIAAVPGQAALVSAEAKRASMTAYRDALVRRQLAAGDRTITIYPAPLLVYPSDAKDFDFTATQIDPSYFQGGYVLYFRIPARDTLRFVTAPPPGYCSGDPRTQAGAAAVCP